jgi:hypothetical protein
LARLQFVARLFTLTAALRHVLDSKLRRRMFDYTLTGIDEFPLSWC